MTSKFYRLLCFQVLIALSWVLPAQNISIGSSEEILEKRQESFSQIQALEDPFEDSLWYQGRLYEFTLKTQSGTPYFFNVVTMPGSLSFNRKIHDDLILSYNLIMDELILWTTFANSSMIQVVLNKYYVDEFDLKHHGSDYHFQLHTKMNPIHEKLKEGFYEVVYDDELRMLVKHKKVLSFDATNVTNSYQYDKEIYLIRDGEMFEVDSRGDYLSAFQEHKKSLRNYMRQEKFSFKKSGTQILFNLCTYSKSLLNQ